MIDEHQTTGDFAPGTYTGKPVNFYGSLARTEATGYGVALMAGGLQKNNLTLKMLK